METLYRKINVSEQNPTKSGEYLTNEGLVFYASTYNGFEHITDPHRVYPDWWLEEISDPTAQLKADKAELLEALKKISKVTDEGYIYDDTDFEVWESELKQVHSEIESLIQKMRQ